MDSHVLSLLKTKEAFELHILSKYQDILDRTFQVVYEVKALVSWEKVYRFSPESQFIMVVGLATLEKGTSLGEAGEVEKELKLSISFTIPWTALDDGTTPYQIADMARSLGIARQVMGPEEFVSVLKEKDTTMETFQEYIPADVTGENVKEEGRETYPHLITSFDFEKLSDKQKEALNFTMMAGTIK